ncbi:trypsin-like serine protease [Hyalangium versicolor]|uniref:trypsin-like serine protease n=1 Tax=Hyalangium versicolor TaxID=2861190 RepID=UPI001CCA60EA|nr:trypsin-like serine protease [Hyalangium versicolor]
MPRLRTALTLTVVAVALLWMGSGCGGRAVSQGIEHFGTGNEISVVSESIVDSENHYFSTVKIKATVFKPGVGHIDKECSGVLIDDRLVLTAGHCVCSERKPVAPEALDTTIVDKRSPCAETGYVRFFKYKSSEPLASDGSVPVEESRLYRGKVQVHQGIKLVYKEVETEPGRTVNATIFSEADIATISLESPVEEKVKPASLARKRVGHNEKVVLVGYGLPYLGGGIGRDRRYGENYVVSRRTDDAAFQVGRQDVEVAGTYSGEVPDSRVKSGSYLTPGDSGGPCFRKVGDEVQLVGVAKSVRAGTLTLSAYTSVFKYLDWLSQRIEESRKAASN